LEERPFPAESPAPDSPLIPNALLDRYDDFCRIHRGLSSATRWVYVKYLIRLRTFLARRHVERLDDITAAHLDAFLFRIAKKAAPKTLQYVGSGLRSFFRYLHIEGRIKTPLHEGLMT